MSGGVADKKTKTDIDHASTYLGFNGKSLMAFSTQMCSDNDEIGSPFDLLQHFVRVQGCYRHFYICCQNYLLSF